MREIRMSGSEGGGVETNRCSLPLFIILTSARIHCYRFSQCSDPLQIG